MGTAVPPRPAFARETAPARERLAESRMIKGGGVAENVIGEIKGQVTDDADAKAKAAERWMEAVNRLGEHGV